MQPHKWKIYLMNMCVVTAKRDCQHFVGCSCGCLLLKIINKRCVELLGKCGVSRDDLLLALLCFLCHISRQCSLQDCCALEQMDWG